MAAELGVTEWGYLLWEQDRRTPKVGYYPRIFAFLGYDPFPSPTTLGERLRARRRELGLSIRRAAKLVGVDEGTLLSWELGRREQGRIGEKVNQFLQSVPPSG